jgi:hypothetical protein
MCVHEIGRRLLSRCKDVLKGDNGEQRQNKTSIRPTPVKHPTLEPLFDPVFGLVHAYELPTFSKLFGNKDTTKQRPDSFQSCTIDNRLDYILFSPRTHGAGHPRGSVLKRDT